MNRTGNKINLADPCLCYAWGTNLIIRMSWFDDCLYCGKADDFTGYKNKLMKKLDCEDSGKLKEHVGIKIEKRRLNKVDTTCVGIDSTTRI